MLYFYFIFNFQSVQLLILKTFLLVFDFFVVEYVLFSRILNVDALYFVMYKTRKR